MPRTGVNYLGVILLVAVFVSGTTAVENQNLNLIKLLSKPWLFTNHWNGYIGTDPHHTVPFDLHHVIDSQLPYDRRLNPEPKNDQDDYDSTNNDNILRLTSEKRSAVATALNSGRRRRQPTPALGKVVTPYLGVGVLNDVDMFFGLLRDNLDVFSSLSPQQRVSFLHKTPSVINVPSSGNSGSVGVRRFHALRPLRPTGNIRSYNRRSFVEADGVYPGANNHDPGLLWTGLGRR